MVIRITNSTIPLYVQAKEAILRFIKNGSLLDNKLPAEENLCEMLGVSRPTVREALMALNREGIISKKHGTGNLVHRSTLETRMRFDKFSDFRALLEDYGYSVDLRSSPFKVPDADERAILEAVGGDADGSLYQENVYIANGVPAIIAYNYPHCSLEGRTIPGREDLFSKSFSELLETLSGEDLAHTLLELKPSQVEGPMAELFEVPVGTAVIKWKEKHYSVFDNLVAESVICFNPSVTNLTTLRKW